MSAGYDLYAPYAYTVAPYSKVLIKTDLQIQVPLGTYGRIAPRSGLALHHHIDVAGGVIDHDYRGNVCVILFNHGSKHFYIKPGNRIAQLICEKIALPIVKECNKLNQTQRSYHGFGSSNY